MLGVSCANVRTGGEKLELFLYLLYAKILGAEYPIIYRRVLAWQGLTATLQTETT